MSVKKLIAPVCIVAVGLVAVVGSIATADSSSDASAVASTEMQLPPGWTEEDMQACMRAATPGDEQAFLVEGAGEWQCETKMWMAPDTEPLRSEGTSTVTPIMDGRYVKVEMKGEMPGMGAYHGFGIYGFDNVSQEFVSTWIDNHSTGIMQGVGERSDNGKTLTWEFTANCPVTQKPVKIREVETITGPNTKTLEMYGPDRKSGKEFKMMSIELTRK